MSSNPKSDSTKTLDYSYGRGQVVHALWAFFTLARGASRSTPKVFETRVRKLLEIDRRDEGSIDGHRSAAHFAFFALEPGGKGVDAVYTPFNAFCLAVGIDLLDAGFKQSEIVFLLRHIHGDLATQYEAILRAPPKIRGHVPAESRPGLPAYERNGRLFADCRVFAVIDKLEMKEVFSTPPSDAPLIRQPTFCRGIQDLAECLDAMNYGHRKALVLEIAYTAIGVTELLKSAPSIRRGRR